MEISQRSQGGTCSIPGVKIKSASYFHEFLRPNSPWTDTTFEFSPFHSGLGMRRKRGKRPSAWTIKMFASVLPWQNTSYARSILWHCTMLQTRREDGGKCEKVKAKANSKTVSFRIHHHHHHQQQQQQQH